MATEELRPIDADHFWIGEVMVDLVQLYREANQLCQWPKRLEVQTHSLAFNLRFLDHVAGCLVRGDTKYLRTKAVADSLIKLNSLGLHTGYVSKEG